MVLMHHQLIDFDYLYNYAIFDGVDGVMRGFVPKPQIKENLNLARSESTKRSTLTNITNQAPIIKLKVISGHFLLNEKTNISDDAEIFV